MRPWWERVAALCLATWFLVTALDLPALHTCGMHGAGATGPEHGGMAAAMQGAMMQGAMMQGATSHQASSHADHGSDHGRAPAHAGHACTCLGACCGAVLAATPAPPLAFHTHVAARPAAPGRPAHEYVAAWVDFVLPFSTPPPARVRV